jgi:NADH:ubiquinone oxidoreductase subunit 6 (subunit J)
MSDRAMVYLGIVLLGIAGGYVSWRFPWTKRILLVVMSAVVFMEFGAFAMLVALRPANKHTGSLEVIALLSMSFAAVTAIGLLLSWTRKPEMRLPSR